MGVRETNRSGSLAPHSHHFFASWFRKNGRSFPWRNGGTTAFGVLTAEVLLRQTRADMVAEVWPSLVSAYPDALSLAAANRSALVSQVSGLGLGQQRTKALIELGRALVSRFNGKVPRDIQQLEELPHVGLYSARAIACFAFGRRVPVVDVNVVRVISRLKGVPSVPDIRRAKHIWRLAWRMLPTRNAKQHNYGLLDFAATICRPRNPLCSACPLAKKCSHFRAARKRGSNLVTLSITAGNPHHSKQEKVIASSEAVHKLS